MASDPKSMDGAAPGAGALAGELALLLVVTLGVHALVLRFVFPGYYAPLRPHHSDFYVPLVLRHSGIGLTGLLKYPRPVGMLFFGAIGFLGLEGSIAAVVGLVLVNGALTGHLARRLAGLEFGPAFLVAYAAVAFAVFAQPFCYVFYTQDAFAHLSYFLLLVGFWLLWRNFDAAPRWALGSMAALACLAFLAKETYAPGALFLAGVWLWRSRHRGFWRAAGPGLAIGVGLGVALAINRLNRSPFIADPSAADAPYRVVLSPRSVLVEWWRYLGEALNPLTAALLVGAVVVGLLLGRGERSRWRILLLGPAVAALSWVPNALLPNHHYAGYSCSGAFLLFSPLLLAAAPGGTGRRKLVPLTALAALVIASPLLSREQLRRNAWTLAQEAIQRNVLKAIRGLPERPLGTQRILVSGVDFPFSPFHHPGSLVALAGIRPEQLDIVTYRAAAASTLEGARFLPSSQVQPARYSRVWAFRSDGTLVCDQENPESLELPAGGIPLRPAELLLFPELLDIFRGTGGDTSQRNQSVRLLLCGTRLLAYGDAGRAERCLQASLLLAPTDPQIHYWLGLAYEKLGQATRARASLERALALGPGPASAPYREALDRVIQARAP